MRLGAGDVDQKLLFCTVALVAVGLVMVFSASSVTSLEKFNDKFHIVKLQAAWAVIGAVVMAILVRTDYRKLRRYSIPCLLATFALLLLVFSPLGHRVNAATRWIVLFHVIRIQPSEIAKLAVILYLADVLSRNYRKRESFRDYLLPNLLILGLIAGCILPQPNLSSAALVLIIGISMISLAHGNLSHIVLVGTAAVAGVLALAFAKPYRLRRLLTFIDPYHSPSGAGYHIIHSLIAVGSGGVLGVGIGQGVQKMAYLPFVNTDFIFAVVGEETGLLGAALILILYLGVLWRGIRIAFRAPDLFGMLLAFGITVGITVQAAVNIAVVLGLMPTTGVPLPLISYGGSSMLLTMASLGILLNISCVAEKESFTKLARRFAPA